MDDFRSGGQFQVRIDMREHGFGQCMRQPAELLCTLMVLTISLEVIYGMCINFQEQSDCNERFRRCFLR